MFWSMPCRRVLPGTVLIALLAIAAFTLAADDKPAAPSRPEGIVPCLAVLADGSPVYPSQQFPPSKRITAAFRIPKDADAKKLYSKWIALDGERTIAENALDLQGQKSGWLRLELKEPAAPGKYRIDTKLDDKAWKSIDLEIMPPITAGIIEKPADLLLVNDGMSVTLDAVITPSQGATMELPPAMAKFPDGSYRGTIVISYDQPNDKGLHRMAAINGVPVNEMRVKMADVGMVCTQKIEKDSTTDVSPPRCVHPLPPSITHGLEWKSPTDVKGADQELAFFGPLTLQGPDGPATGYIIYGEEPVEGAKESSGGPNIQTMERHYIPKLGIIRENRVVLAGGKVATRQEYTLGNPNYKIWSHPKLKGKLGRVQFGFPNDTKSSDARIAIFKTAEPAGEAQTASSAISEGYGEKGFDVLPGKYEASINGRRVPIVVKSGHVTMPRSGVLRVHAQADTHWRVLDPKDKSEVIGNYGEKDVALPPGKYLLEISGATEAISLADGQLLEF